MSVQVQTFWYFCSYIMHLFQMGIKVFFVHETFLTSIALMHMAFMLLGFVLLCDPLLLQEEDPRAVPQPTWHPLCWPQGLMYMVRTRKDGKRLKIWDFQSTGPLGRCFL